MKKQLQRLAAAAALSFASLASLSAQAASVVVDISGAQSVNLLGEAGNTVWLVDIGAGTLLNSLSWAVTLNALDPSRLSELQLSFGGANGLDLVTLAPGEADFSSGTGSYAGTTDLAPLGLAVGSDGLLRIEFSEGFKDFATGTVEGQWVGGNLSFGVTAVPEPASVALMLLGLGLVGAQLRRRAASSGQR